MNIDIFQKKLPPPIDVWTSYPRDNSHIVVTWSEARNPDRGVVNGVVKRVCYNVYKGMSSNGIFVVVNEQPLLTNRYEDHDVSRNPNVVNWYKVSTVYETSGGWVEGDQSKAVCFEVHNTDRWFQKINERNLWILKNTGMLFDLYTRRYAGELCKRCYDDVRGRAGAPDCPQCFGTGFVGGYDPAFQLYVRLKPTENALGVSTQMYVNENAPGAWTISPTKLMNRDLLISPTGVIYHVLSSMINQAGGYLFHQELKLKALDPNDPLYMMKRSTLYPFT